MIQIRPSSGANALVNFARQYYEAGPGVFQISGLTSLFGSASLYEDFTTGTLDPRITFSRTSNATVTGSNGLIQYAPHNLLTYSEQFDNAAWTKANTTITANSTAAPDGTLTADTLTSGAANGYLYQSFSAAASTTYVFSVWVKSVSVGTTLSVYLYASNGGSAVASTSFTTTGNWQRVSVFGNYTTGSTGWAAIGSGGTFPTGQTLYIWGAQLELGSTATTYNPTTVKNLLGYSQAFDNAAWTKSNSFVQTNLLLQSEAFDSANWTKTNATVTADATTAPNNTQTADRVSLTAAGPIVRQTYTTTTAGAYTASVWIKSGSNTSVTLSLRPTGAGSPTSVVVAVTTEWQRFLVSFTAASGITNIQFWIEGFTQDIDIWGAQLVQGSTAGNYQSTTSAAAPVGYMGPLGFVGAQKLVEDTATGQHRMNTASSTTVSGSQYTASIYMKAGERTFCATEIILATGGVEGLFNLTEGTASFTAYGGAATPTGSITNVGNGWYRCAVTFTANGASSSVRPAKLYQDATTQSYTGDGTSGIYIFGAQLSDSASVDPYVYNPVAAPSAAAYYGPRFDYDPVTLAPKGLLIEEQRTNLLLQSETFDSATWTKTNATVTANTVTSPDGTVDADTIDSTSTNAEVFQSVTKAASAITYTASLWVKGSYNNFLLTVDDGTISNRGKVTVDLATGAISGIASDGTFTATSATTTAHGNSWNRITLTTTTNTTTTVRLRCYLAASGRTAYVWGAQLEAGSFATSYIPTVASQVTRAADSASMVGTNFSQWYTQGEGTVYGEAQLVGVASYTSLIFDITAANNTDYMAIGHGGVGSAPYFRSTVGNVDQAIVQQGAAISTTSNKFAGSYAQNSFRFARNGALGTEATSGSVPAVSQLIFANRFGNDRPVSVYIKRIAYYPRRLSNSELQGITS